PLRQKLGDRRRASVAQTFAAQDDFLTWFALGNRRPATVTFHIGGLNDVGGGLEPLVFARLVIPQHRVEAFGGRKVAHFGPVSANLGRQLFPGKRLSVLAVSSEIDAQQINQSGVSSLRDGNQMASSEKIAPEGDGA